MLSREERRAALAIVRAEGYQYDPWGACMLNLLGIAEVLDAYADVPAEWEYSRGAGTPDLEEHPAVLWRDAYDSEDEYLTIEQLRYAGSVLNRWSDMLRHAGKDY